MLSRSVCRDPRSRPEDDTRVELDDLAPRLAKKGKTLLRESVDRPYIQSVLDVEYFDRRLLDRAEADDARGMHEKVDSPAFCSYLTDKRVHVNVVRQVGWPDAHTGRSESPGDLLESVSSATYEPDRCASRKKLACERPTDPTSGAGNDGDRVGKVVHSLTANRNRSSRRMSTPPPSAAFARPAIDLGPRAPDYMIVPGQPADEAARRR